MRMPKIVPDLDFGMPETENTISACGLCTVAREGGVVYITPLGRDDPRIPLGESKGDPGIHRGYFDGLPLYFSGAHMRPDVLSGGEENFSGRLVHYAPRGLFGLGRHINWYSEAEGVAKAIERATAKRPFFEGWGTITSDPHGRIFLVDGYLQYVVSSVGPKTISGERCIVYGEAYFTFPNYNRSGSVTVLGTMR